MWQKDTADVNGDGQLMDPDTLPWGDALAYCENLSFAGYDDWRLPNVRQLLSILNSGRAGRAVDPVFGANSSLSWSSTSYAALPSSGCHIHFGLGVVSDGAEGSGGSVRVVRKAP